jgi:hypothetical protein
VFSIIIVRIGLGIVVDSDTVRMSDGVADFTQRITSEYSTSEHWKHYSEKSHPEKSPTGRR